MGSWENVTRPAPPNPAVGCRSQPHPTPTPTYLMPVASSRRMRARRRASLSGCSSGLSSASSTSAAVAAAPAPAAAAPAPCNTRQAGRRRWLGSRGTAGPQAWQCLATLSRQASSNGAEKQHSPARKQPKKCCSPRGGLTLASTAAAAAAARADAAAAAFDSPSLLAPTQVVSLQEARGQTPGLRRCCRQADGRRRHCPLQQLLRCAVCTAAPTAPLGMPVQPKEGQRWASVQAQGRHSAGLLRSDPCRANRHHPHTC